MGQLLQIDKAIPRTFSPAICRKCGGKCCEAYPGSASPEQFGAPDHRKVIVRLVDALGSGKWQVDWWESHEDGAGYFIRPAVVGDTRIKSPTWGGRCTFLTASGCAFKPANRPAGCTVLKAGPDGGDGDCVSPGYDKKFFADRWKPYWDDIDAAVEALERGA